LSRCRKLGLHDLNLRQEPQRSTLNSAQKHSLDFRLRADATTMQTKLRETCNSPLRRDASGVESAALCRSSVNTSPTSFLCSCSLLPLGTSPFSGCYGELPGHSNDGQSELLIAALSNAPRTVATMRGLTRVGFDAHDRTQHREGRSRDAHVRSEKSPGADLKNWECLYKPYKGCP
jgi:hypothetical protein